MSVSRHIQSKNGSMEIEWDKEFQKLLREQDQFLAGKLKPSAKVVRKPTSASSSLISNASSLDENLPPDLEDIVIDKAGNATKENRSGIDISSHPIFHGIKERFPPSNLLQPTKRTVGGFPSVKKSSIFSLQRQQTSPSPPKLPINSCSLNGYEAENIERIKRMNLEEIIQSQKEIQTIFSPDMIEMLRKRGERKQPLNPSITLKPKTESRDNDKKIANQTLNQTSSKSIERTSASCPSLCENECNKGFYRIQLDKLQHQVDLLDDEEKAKLAWMAPVSSNSNSPDPSSASFPISTNMGDQIRFDFEGKIIEAHEDYPSYSGLYHHGLKPHEAGYSFNELLMLLRSQIPAQRVLSIRTLIRIFQRQHATNKEAVYDFEFPMKKCLVLVRCALDSSNMTVLNSSIHALHVIFLTNTLKFHIDLNEKEKEFDTYRGYEIKPYNVFLPTSMERHQGRESKDFDRVWYFPTSEKKRKDREDDNDNTPIYSPEDLLEVDPIQGLLGMKLLQRFSYLLKTFRSSLDEKSIEQLFDILIEIAQHSPQSAHQIMNCSGLLDIIFEDYLDLNKTLSSAHAKHRIQSYVLFRKLCQADREIVMRFYEKGYFDSMKGVLTLGEPLDSEQPEEIPTLQLEILRIWRVCLMYNVDSECFSYLHPILCGLRLSPSIPSSIGENCKEWSNQHLAGIFYVIEALLHIQSGEMHRIEAIQVFQSSLRVYVHVALTKVVLFLEQCTDGINSVIRADDGLLASMLHFLASYMESIHWISSEKADYVDTWNHFMQLFALVEKESFWLMMNVYKNTVASIHDWNEIYGWFRLFRNCCNNIISSKTHSGIHWSNTITVSASSWIEHFLRPLEIWMMFLEDEINVNLDSLHDKYLPSRWYQKRIQHLLMHDLLLYWNELCLESKKGLDNIHLETMKPKQARNGLKWAYQLLSYLLPGDEWIFINTLASLLCNSALLETAIKDDMSSEDEWILDDSFLQQLISMFKSFVSSSEVIWIHSWVLYSKATTKMESCHLYLPLFYQESNHAKLHPTLQLKLSQLPLVSLSSSIGSWLLVPLSNACTMTRSGKKTQRNMYSCYFDFLRVMEYCHSMDSLKTLENQTQRLLGYISFFNRMEEKELVFDSILMKKLEQLIKWSIKKCIEQDARAFKQALNQSICLYDRHYYHPMAGCFPKSFSNIQKGNEAITSSKCIPTLIENLLSIYTTVSYGHELFSQSICLFFCLIECKELRLMIWKELTLNFMEGFFHPFEEVKPLYFFPLETNQILLTEWQDWLLSPASRQSNEFLYRMVLHHVYFYFFRKKIEDFMFEISWQRQQDLKAFFLSASETLLKDLLMYEWKDPDMGGSDSIVCIKYELQEHLMKWIENSIPPSSSFVTLSSTEQQQLVQVLVSSFPDKNFQAIKLQHNGMK